MLTRDTWKKQKKRRKKQDEKGKEEVSTKSREGKNDGRSVSTFSNLFIAICSKSSDLSINSFLSLSLL